MAHHSDSDLIANCHNTARFFTENRHVSWILLITVLIWGLYSYTTIPKHKDPTIPVRMASIVTPWPGTSAEVIEQLVTRQVEKTVAESTVIRAPDPTAFGIKSLTLPGVSILNIQLAGSVEDTEKAFNDINLKLNAINDQLPPGAGPIQFNSGFGETAALLLTVASPKEQGVPLSLRARSIRRGIEAVRRQAGKSALPRLSLVVAFPRGIEPSVGRHVMNLFSEYLRRQQFAKDIKLFNGNSFIGLDAETQGDSDEFLALVQRFLVQKMGLQRFHPDAWPPIVVSDPLDTERLLQAANGDKYSYSQLDKYTDLLSRSIQNIEQVSKVTRSGVLPQQVFLTYAQDRLAAYGVKPANIKQVLELRNTTVPGGMLQVDDMDVLIEPSGQFTSAAQIGDVMVTRNENGMPLYLRDLVDIHSGYQSPPRLLNFHTGQDENGNWQRSRAISLAILMRNGEQISEFGAAVDAVLESIKVRLPDDLVVVKTSDQPRQSKENIDLFMTALYEAIILVVLVAVIGFREWRSAVLLMISIPVTLALTFGMINLLGIQLQQISIATLIIALGLLVDDPVVAGDAIKRSLAEGQPRRYAAWIGPTKLAVVILFATLTNVVAYVPFLLLTGNTGDFLYSLPVVMACALAASRLVSMSFVPFLGYYLLRAETEPQAISYRRKHGFSGWYFRLGGFALEHRRMIALASLLLLVAGGIVKSQLKDAFFPEDVQYISYVDVWLKNAASIAATDAASLQAEQIIRRVAAEYNAANGVASPDDSSVLQSVTSTIGGSAPRFWFTVSPQLQQPNYAQIIIRVRNREDTPLLVPLWQKALTEKIPGARLDVKQLRTNLINYPVAVRLSGMTTVDPAQEQEDIRTLRKLAEQVQEIFRAVPQATRVHNDWGGDSFVVKLDIDPQRANLSGISNQDVAFSSQAGLSGVQVTTLREGNLQIPVVVRLWPNERAQLSDLKNLYVYASEDDNKVPLMSFTRIGYTMETQRIRRLEQFRTLTIVAFPVDGALASDVFAAAKDKLLEFERQLPPGYKMEISGEQGHTVKGFKELLKVMGISAAAIYLCLVLQFKNAIKPLLVFAAVPFGMVGSLLGLYIMDSPFSYMAFLGIVALIGVIVSHVIVLFDFIEERQQQGLPFREALLDAGIIRLRPVLITVFATVLALFPLAIHGGPLWRPLCYAQIGGLLMATVITLILVPVFYALFVQDIKLIKWDVSDASVGFVDAD